MANDSKEFLKSARFWIAIMTTVFACALTMVVVIRLPDGADNVVGQFYTIWGGIVVFYFSKARPPEKKE